MSWMWNLTLKYAIITALVGLVAPAALIHGADLLLQMLMFEVG